MAQASRETRERAIAAWKSGVSINQICEVLGITRKTFYNWRKRDAEGGEQVPLPKGRPPRILDDTHLDMIKAMYDGNNSLFAHEVRTALGLECDLGVIYRALNELGLTFKKKK